jgi:hypothetical protein
MEGTGAKPEAKLTCLDGIMGGALPEMNGNLRYR